MPDVTASLATLGASGWTPTGDPRYAGFPNRASTLWASRPAANAANVGQEIEVTDYGVGGRSRWVSDGANWRPMNGRVSLWNRHGTLAAPLDTKAAAGANVAFAPADSLVVPAGMLYAGARLCVKFCCRRLAAGGTGGNVNAWFGNNGAFASNLNMVMTIMTSVVNRDVWLEGFVGVNAANAATCSANVGMQGAATAAFADAAGSFDIATAMTLTLGLGSGLTVDNIALLSYLVWIEG